jgi:DHA2 family multidrug resistance protein
MSVPLKGLYGSDLSLLSAPAAALARRGLLKWMIAITAALGAILEIIDVNIVNVALPEIRGNLGATLAEAGWVTTGYACANVVMIPLAAWLGDRFGRRQYLLFSLIGFVASSVLCGLSGSLGMLIFARVMQGLAGGGLLAKAQSLLFETFPREQQPAAQAIFGIGVISGPALGPVLGGYLTDTLGWPWIFFINLPVGILAMVMTAVFLPRDEERTLDHHRVDWAGIGLLTLGLGCLQTMLEEGQSEDWFSSRFIQVVTAGTVLGLGLFVWRELTTKHPAVDLRVLRHKELAAGSLYSMVLGMGLYGVMFAVPIFVQDFLHFTAMQSGRLLLPGAIGAAVMMIAMGKFAARFDARKLIAGGALVMFATALLLSGINPDTGRETLFWPLLLRGFGGVLMFIPLSLATIGNLPKSEIAAGTGFYNLTRQLGSSIGVALITTYLAHREAVHRAVLVERVSPFSAAATDRIDLLSGVFESRGGDAVRAGQQALAVIDRSIDAQAMLLAFSDVFFYVAAAFIATLPLLLLLGRGGRKAPVDVH